MSIFVQRKSSQRRERAICSTSSFAVFYGCSEKNVVHLHYTFKIVFCIFVSHRFSKFLKHKPCYVIRDTYSSGKLCRKYSLFILSKKADGQKPFPYDFCASQFLRSGRLNAYTLDIDTNCGIFM